MKTSKLILALLLPAMVLLGGCPIGIKYSAGNPGKEKIDAGLIGTWSQTDTEKEVVSVKFTKKDDFSYNVEVTEPGEMYGLETYTLVGWVTKIKDKKILFMQPEGETDYYMYEYSINGTTMVSHDIALLDGGIDAVTSTESLRKQIETSLDMEGGLSEETTWTKTP